MATPYGGGAPRQDVPLPDKAPFTAFLGSLSFDVTEGDIADFFAPHKAVSVRIVSDRDGRPKGFGYIEFETLDGLKDALTRSGASLAGRPIRISVAEPPKSSMGGSGFAPSVAEEASQWRRAGPLPPSDPAPSRPGMAPRDRPSQRGGFGDNAGPSGFDNMEVGAGGRSGFGSRFQASPQTAPRGPSFGGSGAGGPPREPREPLEPSKGEVASDWRTGKPVEGAPPRRPGFQHGDNSQEGAGGPGTSRSPSFRQRDATEVDEKYASQERMGFGSKFMATPPDSPSAGRRGPFERRESGQQQQQPPAAGDSADTWRSARGGPRNGAANATSPVAAAPLERKKLDLKPRSQGGAAASASTTSPSSSSKASPFGNAKPVDSSEREKAIEERLRKEREQRAAEAEAARKEKAEKEKRDGVPTGPRADRERAASNSGTGKSTPAAEGASGAAASSPSAAPAAPASAASPSPKPAPTGAWGGGRAASGALAGNKQQQQQQQLQQDAEKTKDANGNGNAAATAGNVDGVTKGVEGVKVNDA